MSDNSPLVSIIMNCYNSDRYLREAIDSVYAQTYLNWEIIFWDNFSDDKSQIIAKSYDEKLKYFRSDKHTILGEARYLAAKEASGKYLAFLDCDDIWLKDKLKKQVNLFLSSDQNLGFIYGRTGIISNENNNSHFPKLKDPLYQGKIFKYLCKGNFIPFVSVIVDRVKFEECGGFAKHIKHSTDYVLFLELAYKYHVKAMDGVDCKYRIHENNLTNKLRIKAAKESINAVEKFLPDKDAISGLKFQHLNIAIAYFKNQKYFQALTIIIQYNLFNLLFNRLRRKIS